MSRESRLEALERAGLVHPRPGEVTAELFCSGRYFLVAAAFAERGMAGLADQRRGRKGPTKLSAEIAEFLRSAPPERSGAELAAEVETRFAVSLHRRTAERARRR